MVTTAGEKEITLREDAVVIMELQDVAAVPNVCFRKTGCKSNRCTCKKIKKINYVIPSATNRLIVMGNNLLNSFNNL